MAGADRLHQIGRELLDASAKHDGGKLLSKRFWNDKLMAWAMKDEAFKVQLFRFIDAFPNFQTPEAVHEHLIDFMTQPGVTPPPGMRLGLAAGGAMKTTMAKTITQQVKAMAGNFIAGTDAESAVPTLRRQWDQNLAFSVDLLGEACISEAEADGYQRKYLDLIENLPTWVNDWPARPHLERDHLGPIPRTNVSVKISALAAHADPISFDWSIAHLMERLVPILRTAAAKNVFINFDMEDYASKNLTIALFKQCAEAVEFDGGIALQAYLRDGDTDAHDLADWAKRAGRVVTVRLVKGAYWDYETIHANQMGWPVPVWATKRQTDACFERMSRTFIDSTPSEPGQGGVKLALGSHNLRSIAAALTALEERGLPDSAIELQMLYGMADQLKAATAERGLRVRSYIPVGEMIPGMAYLVRRLLENTSNESWLMASTADRADPDELLASPHEPTDAGSAPPPHGGGPAATDAPERHQLSAAVHGVGDDRPFFTEPFRDFADAEQRAAFERTIQAATVPVVANDGTTEQTDQAVAAAHAAFPAWRDTDVLERANCLVRAADLMRQRRDELAGVVLKENGKDWRNADGDVCEAIDFCEFYAREAVALCRPERLGQFVGELNEQWHEPRGVCAVISPWNFPLAIPAGMAAAALVMGNTVILKPAEQTPGTAKILVDILHESGVPRDVLHFLPGDGETVGQHLSRHVGVDMVAFTGSTAVGRQLLRDAVEHPPSRRLARHVVCETGGKNAILVDASADLDEAVLGVRDSAFGFAGQKCSACSRAIVVDDLHDAFVARLVESTKSLHVGDPLDSRTDLGPVIDDDAAASIRRFIDKGKAEATLAHPTTAAGDGRFIVPHIFTDVDPDATIATEEVFGPVLAVTRARDFGHALHLATDSGYRLTGGVYTRKPSHLTLARQQFRVGNLYLNRGCTGALVARQPFGGTHQSGLGTKAGGRAYLQQFAEPRAVTENTMRRGFAPEPSA
jgi:RHH-type proline utilization regulon transcriptional repressor/proline dehydrogenase/delta 1-pyrroline-5-carboxylate dehydrogenase